MATNIECGCCGNEYAPGMDTREEDGINSCALCIAHPSDTTAWSCDGQDHAERMAVTDKQRRVIITTVTRGDHHRSAFVTRRSKISEAAAALGRRGGQVSTEAKAEAARANGAKGGRPPRLTPAQVREVRSLMEDEGMSRREATAWVRHMSPTSEVPASELLPDPIKE